MLTTLRHCGIVDRADTMLQTAAGRAEKPGQDSDKCKKNASHAQGYRYAAGIGKDTHDHIADGMSRKCQHVHTHDPAVAAIAGRDHDRGLVREILQQIHRAALTDLDSFEPIRKMRTSPD